MQALNNNSLNKIHYILCLLLKQHEFILVLFRSQMQVVTMRIITQAKQLELNYKGLSLQQK